MQSYSAAFLRSKTLQNDKPDCKSHHKISATTKLSESRRAAYHWGVDIAALKVLDEPNLTSITDAFSPSNFLALFKVARFFGVNVTSSRSS
jgi:hypothetical protein